MAAFRLSVHETFKYLWFWVSLTGLSWKDTFIAGSRGTVLISGKGWHQMEVERGIIRCVVEHQQLEIWVAGEKGILLGGRNPLKNIPKTLWNSFLPVSHQYFRTLRILCFEWFMFKGQMAEFHQLYTICAFWSKRMNHLKRKAVKNSWLLSYKYWQPWSFRY